MDKQKQEVRRVSDVVSSEPLLGEQVKVSDLVDTEFVVNSISERDGDWGPYLGVEIEVEGEEYYFFTAHQVVMSKLRKCEDQFPLLATIAVRESKESDRTYFDIG